MAKYKKKPVTIEAWRTSVLLADARSNWNDLPKQIRAAYDVGNILFANDYILIQTLEGKHRADIADLVICGVAGELYPCKPEIFAKTYEHVEDDET